MRFGRRCPAPPRPLIVVLIAVPALAAVPLTRVSNDPYTNTASPAPDRGRARHLQLRHHDRLRLPGRPGLRGRVGQHRLGPLDQRRRHLDQRFPARHHHRSAGGSFSAISDPAVAFDAPHNVWLISSLGIRSNGTNQVLTSRSTNGGATWSNPVPPAPAATRTRTGSSATTPPPARSTATATPSGTTPPTATGSGCRPPTTAGSDLGTGPQQRRQRHRPRRPTGGAAQRHGPGADGQRQRSPRSGRSAPSTAAPAGGPRCWCPASAATPWPAGCATSPLPSAEMDAAGTAYVVWQDCRFRSGCTSNDIVMSKSTSETTWGAGHPGADRRHLQHRGPLHPRHRGGPSTSGGQRPHRPDLLLLSDRGLHLQHLPAQRRLHLLHQRRHQLERGTNVDRPDVAVLAGQHLPGPHVRRLHLHLGATPGPADGRGRPIAVATAPSGGLFNEAMYVPTGGLPVSGGTARASAAGVVVAGPSAAAKRAPAAVRR